MSKVGVKGDLKFGKRRLCELGNLPELNSLKLCHDFVRVIFIRYEAKSFNYNLVFVTCSSARQNVLFFFSFTLF